MCRLLSDSSEVPTSIGENYGQRLRGWFHAEHTGPHLFSIASDDASQLWLGTDDRPSTIRPIASVVAWTPQRDFAIEPGQRSAPVDLVAGRRYFLQVLHKEGSGGDHLSFAVDFPGGTSEKPLAVGRLEPFPTEGLPDAATSLAVTALVETIEWNRIAHNNSAKIKWAVF